AINFATQQGGKFTVQTGPGPNQSFDFDYASGLTRVAIENAVLKIEDYVYISGGLAFTRQQGLTVPLSGTGGDRVVDAFAFGAGNVDLFAGSSPNGDYFADTNGDHVIDESDDRAANATGLVLENVNFGLVVMRPTGVDATLKHIKYLAIKATASFAGLVGI